MTGVLAALDWLAGLRPDVVVPGHGPVLTGADIERVLDEHRRYYRFVLDTAQVGLSRGLTPLDAARAVELGEFAGWSDAERIVLNLHRVYADRAGRDLDLMGAFADAMTWLGGPLHTHV